MIYLINHPKVQQVKIREARNGYWITFQNGWGLSVQWQAAINSCDHDGSTAEIAVLKPGANEVNRLGGELLDGVTGGEYPDQVIGYCTSDRVLRFMNVVSELDAEAPDHIAVGKIIKEA